MFCMYFHVNVMYLHTAWSKSDVIKGHSVALSPRSGLEHELEGLRHRHSDSHLLPVGARLDVRQVEVTIRAQVGVSAIRHLQGLVGAGHHGEESDLQGVTYISRLVKTYSAKF